MYYATNKVTIFLEDSLFYNLQTLFSKITMLLPEIHIYVFIIFGILFFISLLLILYKKRKNQILKRVYLKLSDSDKQVFHIIRATERQTTPTIQNISTFFYKINNKRLKTEQLLQRLYRLETIGLVKISVSTWKGQSVQLCESIFSDHPIADIISKRYKLFLSMLIPLSICIMSICYFLLQFLDLIVHGDLYEFGLVFSYEWANQCWNITALIRDLFNISLILLGICLVLTVITFLRFKKTLKIISGALLMLAVPPISYSIFLLSNLDFLIHNDLYNFGLKFSYQWAEPYWTNIGLLYSLLAITVVLIFICFIFCLYSKPKNLIIKK